jgi:hypothetical protein
MTKAEYLRGLLVGKVANPLLVEAALIYWHSGIPFEEAKVYFNNLETKTNRKGQLNGTRHRLPVKARQAD